MEENEREEGGISLGDIFRTIFSQKWLALIVAVVVAVVCAVGLYFINKPKTEYVASFVMRLPGTGNTPETYTYPDGTRFHFTDLMSTENLLKVKAKSADYSEIDVEKMVQDGAISIARETNEVVANSSLYETRYTLRIKAKYFNTVDIARNFIIDITQIPLEHFKSMSIDYDSYLDSASMAKTYGTQLSYLQNQVDYIRALYSDFIDSYNGSFVVKDGKTLNAYKAQIDVFVSNNDISRLNVEARDNGYIKSLDAIKIYESELSNLERQLAREEAALKNLLSVQSDEAGSIIYASDIINQTLKVEQLKKEKEDLTRYINSKTIDADFAAEVEAVTEQIKAFTVDFNEVASVVYERATTVSFADANVIKSEGGMGLMMVALLSIVLAVLIAAIVAYIVGWNKRKKVAVSPAPTPIYFEAQAQTAATDETKEDEEHTKE